MKKIMLVVFVLITGIIQAATATFTVGTSNNAEQMKNFYPVIFKDTVCWSGPQPMEFYISRPDTYEYGGTKVNRGTLMAKFVVRVSNWGNRTNFIEADIKCYNMSFVAGWRDLSTTSTGQYFAIWLRGGLTYKYDNTKVTVAPIVYMSSSSLNTTMSGILAKEIPMLGIKTAVEPYVNSNGLTYGYKLPNLEGEAFSKSYDAVFHGKVGIGVSNPVYPLTVEGTIGAREIIVTQSATWADYVFEPDYKLMKLPELENFVKTNKHLPGIDDAKTVKDNGVNVGNMQAKLLEKIEELTLHIIELNKRIEKLEAQKK